MTRTHRMRDGAMGGSPFESPDTQGFVTGLYTDPNGAPHQVSNKRNRVTFYPDILNRKQHRLRHSVMLSPPLLTASMPLAPPSPSQGDAQQQLATLLTRSDWVRYALAGNIR